MALFKDEKYEEIELDFPSDGIKVIKRLADEAFIPCNPQNRDYQEFLAHRESKGKQS